MPVTSAPCSYPNSEIKLDLFSACMATISEKISEMQRQIKDANHDAKSQIMSMKSDIKVKSQALVDIKDCLEQQNVEHQALVATIDKTSKEEIGQKQELEVLSRKHQETKHRMTELREQTEAALKQSADSAVGAEKEVRLAI